MKQHGMTKEQQTESPSERGRMRGKGMRSGHKKCGSGQRMALAKEAMRSQRMSFHEGTRQHPGGMMMGKSRRKQQQMSMLPMIVGAIGALGIGVAIGMLIGLGSKRKMHERHHQEMQARHQGGHHPEPVVSNLRPTPSRD